jgi:hypothetical protein
MASKFAITAAILDGKEYSVGFLERSGYVQPFSDFKANHPEAVIIPENEQHAETIEEYRQRTKAS